MLLVKTFGLVRAVCVRNLYFFQVVETKTSPYGMCTVRVLPWTRCRHNHGMAEVGRELWAHLVPAPLQQGHPEQGAQAHVQVAFGALQGGAPTASGQPVPGLQHPHSTAVLPGVSREPLVSHFGPKSRPSATSPRFSGATGPVCLSWWPLLLSRSQAVLSKLQGNNVFCG